MTLIAVYDACVLYPAPLRDLLIRIAECGLVRACWSERILDECFRSIRRTRPELAPHALDRTRNLMTRAVRDCLVTGYEPLVDGLSLPDPNDRHVLAAAIHAKADVIVTLNLRDFPQATLLKHRLSALHPDNFVLELIEANPQALFSIVRDQVSALKNPVRTQAEVLVMLRANGLVQAVVALERLGA
jgi:predicted nucleic acid-binding protein